MTAEEHIAELLQASSPHFVGVNPYLIARTKALISAACYNNLFFGAFMGLRTWTQQDALYAQGRTTPGTRVTKAKGGESWHNFGLAIDLVEDGDPDQAGVQWSWAKNADYLLLGQFAKNVGLDWGGFWKSFKDYPHVELTGGLSLDEARSLYATGGNAAVWIAVERRLGLTP